MIAAMLHTYRVIIDSITSDTLQLHMDYARVIICNAAEDIRNNMAYEKLYVLVAAAMTLHASRQQLHASFSAGPECRLLLYSKLHAQRLMLCFMY